MKPLLFKHFRLAGIIRHNSHFLLHHTGYFLFKHFHSFLLSCGSTPDYPESRRITRPSPALRGHSVPELILLLQREFLS